MNAQTKRLINRTASCMTVVAINRMVSESHVDRAKLLSPGYSQRHCRDLLRHTTRTLRRIWDRTPGPQRHQVRVQWEKYLTDHTDERLDKEVAEAMGIDSSNEVVAL